MCLHNAKALINNESLIYEVIKIKCSHNKIILRAMPKSRKAGDWLSMALEDLDDAHEDYNSGRYASSVFHAELSAQKAVKALIAAFGFEAPKTHRPTQVLKSLISGGLIDLPSQLMEKIGILLSYATTLEDQGTTPRYGWETVDRIIKPSEIYSKDIASSLLKNAEKVCEIAREIIGEMDC